MAESKSLDIRNALRSRLQAIQLDDEPAFTEVSGIPFGEFDSYPSARILPSVQDNEKAAFRQNDRTPSWVIRTYLPFGAADQEASTDKMYVLMDAIFDALDEADQDNTFQEAIGTYILAVDRGEWSVDETAVGVVLYADINVEVSYSKDL
ncbi:hypothetical protein [Rathayibacter sp. AY1C5]|uniref:hypothetical protein n=1 Tax=Rathayibacter sp. AY1C5 TaxID=2080538 RepID=UPI000CE78AEB|nr:hypothetical protein [Rathayibacter sp. AY1C5]PPG60261.1 hypothetical protein C5C57_05525 [Rathayibacter sp. AY1C5]